VTCIAERFQDQIRLWTTQGQPSPNLIINGIIEFNQMFHMDKIRYTNKSRSKCMLRFDR